MYDNIVSVIHAAPGTDVLRVTYADAGECFIQPHDARYPSALAFGPAPFIPPGATAADVKAEARRRILARYSEWKQANMNAEASALLLARIEAGSWTLEQTTHAGELQAAKAWIDNVRAASDAIEARLAAEPGLDIGDDSLWPAS